MQDRGGCTIIIILERQKVKLHHRHPLIVAPLSSSHSCTVVIFGELEAKLHHHHLRERKAELHCCHLLGEVERHHWRLLGKAKAELHCCYFLGKVKTGVALSSLPSSVCTHCCHVSGIFLCACTKHKLLESQHYSVLNFNLMK